MATGWMVGMRSIFKFVKDLTAIEKEIAEIVGQLHEPDKNEDEVLLTQLNEKLLERDKFYTDYFFDGDETRRKR